MVATELADQSRSQQEQQKHITTHSAMRGLFFYKEILAQPSIELIEPSRPTGIRHGHGGGRE